MSLVLCLSCISLHHLVVAVVAAGVVVNGLMQGRRCEVGRRVGAWRAFCLFPLLCRITGVEQTGMEWIPLNNLGECMGVLVGAS